MALVPPKEVSFNKTPTGYQNHVLWAWYEFTFWLLFPDGTVDITIDGDANSYVSRPKCQAEVVAGRRSIKRSDQGIYILS